MLHRLWSKVERWQRTQEVRKTSSALGLASPLSGLVQANQSQSTKNFQSHVFQDNRRAIRRSPGWIGICLHRSCSLGPWRNDSVTKWSLYWTWKVLLQRTAWTFVYQESLCAKFSSTLAQQQQRQWRGTRLLRVEFGNYCKVLGTKGSSQIEAVTQKESTPSHPQRSKTLSKAGTNANPLPAQEENTGSNTMRTRPSMAELQEKKINVTWPKLTALGKKRSRDASVLLGGIKTGTVLEKNLSAALEKATQDVHNWKRPPKMFTSRL